MNCPDAKCYDWHENCPNFQAIGTDGNGYCHLKNRKVFKEEAELDTGDLTVKLGELIK